MNFLSADSVVEMNARLLRYGGLAAGGPGIRPVEGTLQINAYMPYGEELHRGLRRKAAAYAYYIIRDHVFHDGNKRTGMLAAFGFLAHNGHPVVAVSPEQVVEMALAVANGTVSIDELAAWLKAAT